MIRNHLCLSAVFLLLFVQPALCQETKHYQMVVLDAHGELRRPKDWAKTREDICARKPAHVFVLAHGWRTSTESADGLFEALAEQLHKQCDKNETIEVIGVHWPSLLGDNGEIADASIRGLATLLEKAVPKGEAFDEVRAKLKDGLKNPGLRFFFKRAGMPIPDEVDTDVLVDSMEKSDKIAAALTFLTYYRMKSLANEVGSKGVRNCLTELQERLPEARFHLVGHSFGCKVCLACLAGEGRLKQPIDSLTLLQGAVSMHCFAAKIKELEDAPGAYAETPRCVRGCIAVTHTTNDKALTLAYVAASQAAGHVAELAVKKRQFQPSIYGALGARGVAGVDGVHELSLAENDTVYVLRPGLNSINAGGFIRSHNDIRNGAVVRLIWVAARLQPF